jgi:hypothetical protein
MRQIRASILWLAALAPLSLACAHDVPEGLRKCTAESSDAKRLACFDREMAALMSDTGATAKAVPSATSASNAKAAPAAAGTTAPAAASATAAAAAAAAPAAKAPAATAAASDTTLSAEERFGLSDEQQRKKENQPEPDKVDHLNATVTALSKRPQGELVVTLDNKQVWAQRYPESFVVNVGDTVTIKSTFIGSYLMVLRGQTTRVSRVH